MTTSYVLGTVLNTSHLESYLKPHSEPIRYLLKKKNCLAFLSYANNSVSLGELILHDQQISSRGSEYVPTGIRHVPLDRNTDTFMKG